MSANKRMTAERLVAATPKRRANPAKQAGGVSYARADLDPMFYADLETFRMAVANETVDVAKGCRDMDEYRYSLENVHV